MRFLIVDRILEQHVQDSLADALQSLGHEVRQTGPIWKGVLQPEGEDAAEVHAVVDGILADPPDVVFVMRTSTLRPDEVERLNAAGIRTVAWFSDDPVLYAVHTAAVAPAYSLTLHTGTEPVLRMYDNELKVRGWHFPFFTDQAHFPRLWNVSSADLDVVFIGNTHNAVKRWRYDLIAGLDAESRIYGKVWRDRAGICEGQAETDLELARAAARGRWGLNLNQRFADYAESRWNYPKLAGFGEFSLPSRVIQLGAVGVPCVTYTRNPTVAENLNLLYPPVAVARSQEDLQHIVTRTPDEELVERSEAMYEWFARHHTALARARFLLWLLRDEQVARKSGVWAPGLRATAFLEFTTPAKWRVDAARRLRRWLPAEPG